MSFEEKLSPPTDKVIAYLIPNDWKHLLSTKGSHESLFKIFITMLKMQEK